MSCRTESWKNWWVGLFYYITGQTHTHFYYDAHEYEEVLSVEPFRIGYHTYGTLKCMKCGHEDATKNYHGFSFTKPEIE